MGSVRVGLEIGHFLQRIIKAHLRAVITRDDGSFVLVTQITDREVYFLQASRHGSSAMEKPIMTAIGKLVLAGGQAGFSVEQMIQLLQTGGSVETLLCLIELRLSPPTGNRSSRWVM